MTPPPGRASAVQTACNTAGRLFSCAGNGPGAEHPEKGITVTITHPDQIHAAFEAAANAHDVDAMLALYDTDGIAVELDGSPTTGREAMRASFEGLLAGLRHITGTDRKLFVAGDVALLSGTWTAQFGEPDGSIVEAEGVTAEVAVRQADGSWLLVIDDPSFV
jgi:uncharacterized protein (TIGR02246 family)